jgi:hypothetical protein
VYFVEGEKVIPKHILMDGNGHIDKVPYLSFSFIVIVIVMLITVFPHCSVL